LAHVNGYSGAGVAQGEQVNSPRRAQEEDAMHRFTWLVGGAVVTVALWAPVVGAQDVNQDQRNSYTQDNRDIRQDRREIARDKREIRQDRWEMGRDQREIAQDRHRLRQDMRAGDWRAVAADRAELRKDRRDLFRDRQELARDKRELRHDRRELRHDFRDEHGRPGMHARNRR
jgi:DNA repair exonuclease SbcCD ATPase subunit